MGMRGMSMMTKAIKDQDCVREVDGGTLTSSRIVLKEIRSSAHSVASPFATTLAARGALSSRDLLSLILPQ